MREALSADCDIKRQKFSHMLEELCNKIRASHPSIRPRMNTPSGTTSQGSKLPPPPPPLIPEQTSDDENEMYTEFDPSGGGEAENYLEFEPSQTGGDSSQEVYEAMNPEEEDDVYEEPSKFRLLCFVLCCKQKLIVVIGSLITPQALLAW